MNDCSRQCSRVLCLMFLAMTVLAAGCAKGTSVSRAGYDFSQIQKVAVVIDSNTLSRPQQQEFADLFSMELLGKGWDVIDRANIDQIITEGDFQNESGLTSAFGRQQLAIHNVDALIIGNVPQFGENSSLTVKMLEIESGSQLWIGQGTASAKSGMSTIGGALIGAAAGAGAGYGIGGKDGAAIGGIVGGAGGGLAGAIFEPSQAEMARKLIRKVSKDMPTPF